MADIPVDIEALEAALKAHLEPVTDPFDVEPFPADFREYLEVGMANCDGKILQISRGGDMQSVTESFDAPMYRSDLVLLFRSAIQDQQQHTGGYKILKAMIESLHGKLLVIQSQPFRCKIATWRFIDRIENIYVWAVRLEAKHKLKR